MSKKSKNFRHSISSAKRYKKTLDSYKLFRSGKLMKIKYAKGYCCNHNCLLCAHDIKCKGCWNCKHFIEDLVNAM